MECIYNFERSVNEVLWYSIFDNEKSNNNFENDVFQIKQYSWDDEHDNDYHFWHKPSGLKIQWYKYPLRSPKSNMEITNVQFLDVLRDCHNSLKTGSYYYIETWW